MIEELLRERQVPKIPKTSKEDWAAIRESYKETLLREEYGPAIPEPTEEWFEEAPMGYYERSFCAGYANFRRIVAHTVVNGAEFSFPFYAIYPSAPGKYPFFVNNDFSDELQTKTTPTEEIVMNGFAMFHLCYRDVTEDNPDFSDGLARCVIPQPQTAVPLWRKEDAPGKLCMWAWANMRVLDYALQQPYVDPRGAAVIGLSRLGKTALLTGMLDERFRFVVSTGAGCSGDALYRGKTGENISKIADQERFYYWFCPRYYHTYRDDNLPDFDQHMLLATIAPRHLLIGSAELDSGADPVSQYLSCAAASVAWENLGTPGFVHPDRLPQVGDVLREGNVAFSLRAGDHYQLRSDWHFYMDTIKEALAKES